MCADAAAMGMEGLNVTKNKHWTHSLLNAVLEGLELLVTSMLGDVLLSGHTHAIRKTLQDQSMVYITLHFSLYVRYIRTQKVLQYDMYS